jgi:hypothetical protein
MKGRYVPRGEVYKIFNDPEDCFFEIRKINYFFRDCFFKGIRSLDSMENVMKTTDSPMYKFYEMAMLRADVRMKRVRTEMFDGIVVREDGCYIV